MGSNRWRSTLEVAANLATIAVLGYTSYAIWTVRHAANAPFSARNPAQGSGQATTAAKLKDLTAKFRAMPLARRTVLIAMSPTCEYCQQETPLFKRLVDASRQNHGFDVLFVAPEQGPDAAEYLARNAIQDPDVHRIRLVEAGISDVPLLAVVEPAGSVSHVWNGLISGKREQEVLQTILTTAP